MAAEGPNCQLPLFSCLCIAHRLSTAKVESRTVMFGVMEGRGQHQAAQGSSPGPPDTRKQAQRRLQRVWGHFSGVTGCGERMWPGTVWGERGAGASRRRPRRALGPMNSAWAKGRGRRAALYRTAAFVIDRVALRPKSSSAQYCPSSDGRGDRIERLLSLHELFTGSSAPLSGASSASRSRTVAYSAARRFQRRTPARSESR